MTPAERREIEDLGDRAAAELAIHAEMLTPLEEPDRGYCLACNLPSLLAWQVAFEVAADFTIRTVTVCTECGEESAE